MRRLLVLVLATVLLAGCSGSDEPEPRSTSACNGHDELCERGYDEVAYAATHNSMSAAAEPGWFAPEQPEGIIAQLDYGIRVLLVDSWYGQPTERRGVVATADGSRPEALDQARADFGRRTIDVALRARSALGLAPTGEVRPYLCHALCELGSTSWSRSLRDMKDWLDEHPREVVTLFVQDEVTSADTAEVIDGAGLGSYVYTPAEDGAWPTLGEMIDAGTRLVVLLENETGGARYPWLIPGFEVVQDTPYLFESPADFSCAENRGPADAPLLLVNHWIDDWQNVPQNSAVVNARDVLLPRLQECEDERGQLPNFVAVDWYDRGDLLGVVDELNGVG